MNFQSLLQRFWKAFIRGIAMIAPLAITIIFVLWLVGALENLMGTLLRSALPVGWYLPGFGFVAGMVLIATVGLLPNIFWIQWLVRSLEKLVDRTPIVKYLFQAIKDISRFISSDRKESLGEVVAVELDDRRMIGFIVQKENKNLQRVVDPEGPGLIAVYLPMSYQMGGFTVYLNPDRIARLDVAPGTALRAILTGGSFENREREG